MRSWRHTSLALLLLATSLPVAAAAQRSSPKLRAVDRALLPATGQIQDWLAQKDSWGPAYTGSPAWQKFMALVRAELARLGAVNLLEHSFPYTRWHTSEFPDKSGWSLTSDGTPVAVASYGTQSGSTGPGGVTAPMALYDLGQPVEKRPPLAALAGKIVVVKQQPYASFGTAARLPLGVPAPTTQAAYCGNPPACRPPVRTAEPPSPRWGNPGPLMGFMDYEYRSDGETYPTKLFEKAPVSVESSFRNRDQFGQIRDVITHVLVPSEAAAAVTVMDLSPLAAAGTRIHPTPRQFNVPLLMLDRVAGAKLLADAAAGKSAHLVLDAREEQNATAYELLATLPGRDYGTPSDESILLATHLDGPSVVEDDGGLAILAVLHYYAQLPQAERPRSLIAFFDTRHFVPGTEGSYPFDLVKDRPDLFRTVVGGVAMEHFGGLQFVEDGDSYKPTGKPATTYIWGWPNALAIQEAIAAVKDQHLPRAIVDVPARPGVNGKPQQGWLGGGFSRYLVDLGGWPGWHVSGDWPSAGFQAYYPAVKTRLSAELFRTQSAVAVQLVNALMIKDVIALAPAWGYLQTAIDLLDKGAARDRLQQEFASSFALVQQGNYAQVRGALLALAGDAGKSLTGAAAESFDGALSQARNLLDRAVARQASRPNRDRAELR